MLDGLRNIWDKITSIVVWGIGLKVLLIIGMPTIVIILAFAWKSLVVPAFHALFYLLDHLGQIFGTSKIPKLHG